MKHGMLILLLSLLFAAPLLCEEEPQIPVARDFLLPMRTWNRNSLLFGSTWRHAKCPTCEKSCRHVGHDVNCGKRYAGMPVFATEAGIVRQTFADGGWKYCVVIEHRCANGSRLTSVCWHLTKPL